MILSTFIHNYWPSYHKPCKSQTKLVLIISNESILCNYLNKEMTKLLTFHCNIISKSQMNLTINITPKIKYNQNTCSNIRFFHYSNQCKWDFFGLEWDCLRSTENLLRYCRNSYPWTGNSHLYWLLVIVSFSCISFFKIKIRRNRFHVCLKNALYFIVAYEFTHAIINVPMMSFNSNIHS